MRLEPLPGFNGTFLLSMVSGYFCIRLFHMVGIEGGRNERNRGTTKVGEISKIVQESWLLWYAVWACIEKRRRICGQESDCDGCAGEKNQSKIEAEVVDNIKNDLSERVLSREDVQDLAKGRRLKRHIDPT